MPAFLGQSQANFEDTKDQLADPGLDIPRSACNGRNTEYGAERKMC